MGLGHLGLGFATPSLGIGSIRGVEFFLIAQGASSVNFVRQFWAAARSPCPPEAGPIPGGFAFRSDSGMLAA